MLFAQAVSTTVHKTAAAACGASVNHSQTRKEKRHGKRRKCFGNHRPQSILRCTSRKNRKDIHPIRYRVDDRLVLRARFLPHSRASDRKSRILLRSVSSRIRLRCAFHSPVYKLVQKISDSGISSLNPGDRYSRILHGACHVQDMARALVGLHDRIFEHRRICLSEKRPFLRCRSADTHLHSRSRGFGNHGKAFAAHEKRRLGAASRASDI